MKMASQEAMIGMEIQPLVRTVTAEVSQALAGWPEIRSYHTDEKLAKDFGFPSILAPGTVGFSYLSMLCHSFFGDTWYRSGKLSAKFIAPIFTPARLTARAVVKEKTLEGSRTVLTLEVWLEDEKGQKVQVGIARCPVE